MSQEQMLDSEKEILDSSPGSDPIICVSLIKSLYFPTDGPQPRMLWLYDGVKSYVFSRNYT
jgi:hypothetical protein